MNPSLELTYLVQLSSQLEVAQECLGSATNFACRLRTNLGDELAAEVSRVSHAVAMLEDLLDQICTRYTHVREMRLADVEKLRPYGE